MSHPQMIKLQQILLGKNTSNLSQLLFSGTFLRDAAVFSGGPEVRFDHNTLLSRRSFIGQHWHSHNYVEDNYGRTAEPGGAKLRLVRSLVYPDGFGADNDGGLKVVPGAHLYRSRDLADSEPTAPAYEYNCVPGELDDADFSGSWLKDKLHPITGEPLKIQRLELPPGSMVVVLHHSPHVSEK